MKNSYRLYRRGTSGVFYKTNNETGEQTSLKTRDKKVAIELLAAANAQEKGASLNMAVGKAHIQHADPALLRRTWQMVMDEYSQNGQPQTQKKAKRTFARPAFNGIRNQALVETTSQAFQLVMQRGGVATQHYLRRLHNLALGLGWIHWPVIAPKAWPRVRPKHNRGITFQEQQKILAHAGKEEWRHYYRFLWLVGCAQTDGANMAGANIVYDSDGNSVIKYRRKKNGQSASLSVGRDLGALLAELPRDGFLFPTIVQMTETNRARAFRDCCCRAGVLPGVKDGGVTLHSYRYAWAERALAAGYPERYAQAALGHKSKAMAQFYARGGEAICPPLEDNIIPFKSKAA